MQKKIFITYFLIFVTLLTILSFSRHTSEKMRGRSVAFLSPLWERLLSIKFFFTHPSQPSPFSSFSPEEERQQLQVENQLLTTELAYLHQLLEEQTHLSSHFAHISLASPEEAHLLTLERYKTLKNTINHLKYRLKAIPALVIFRSFDTWNSALWINVGETTNQDDQLPIVAINSPVILGRALIGVIDYVGDNQSRVRLITDNRLTPSVRASRGGEQDFFISECIESLLQQLNRKKSLPLAPDHQLQLIQFLKQLQQNLKPFKKSWYLAKGELRGTPSFTRRGQKVSLKGTGFNYDFSDEEGEGRDLRTGKLLQQPEEAAVPLLKVDDILITTGMDGVFPPGLQVATISKIELLKEGDYYYDLEAKPIAGSLEELALVFVLPPLQEKFSDKLID